MHTRSGAGNYRLRREGVHHPLGDAVDLDGCQCRRRLCQPFGPDLPPPAILPGPGDGGDLVVDVQVRVEGRRQVMQP